MSDWRRLPLRLYRSYEASSEGEIRRNGKLLKGYVDRYGYRTVLLSYAGISRRFKVGRLVCETFTGPCPAGLECAHLDGDCSNDRAENVAWVTHSENTKHQILHGTFAGAANATRVPEEVVSQIRKDAAEGLGGRRLSAKYGISRAHAYRLVSGKQRAPKGDANA